MEARWLGLPTRGDAIETETLDLDGVMKRIGFSDALVNSGQAVKRASALQSLVPAVVAEARERVTRGRREHVKTALAKRARAETRRLEAWVERSLALIDEEAARWSKRGARLPRHVEDRLQRERTHIAHVQRNHEELLKSLQATGEPSIRLAAVFSGE